MQVNRHTYQVPAVLLFLICVKVGIVTAQGNVEAYDGQWFGVMFKYQFSPSIGGYTSQYFVSMDNFRIQSLRSEYSVYFVPVRNLNLSAAYYQMPHVDEFDNHVLAFAARFHSKWETTPLTVRSRLRYDHHLSAGDHTDFLRCQVSMRYHLRPELYAEAGLEPFLELGNEQTRISRYEASGSIYYKLQDMAWFKPYLRYRKVDNSDGFANYLQFGLEAGIPMITSKRQKDERGISFELRMRIFYTRRS